MHIVEKRIDAIKPYERNPRKNDGAVMPRLLSLLHSRRLI
jgi:hypothetical protein